MKIGTFNKFCGYKGTIEYDCETKKHHGKLIDVDNQNTNKILYDGDSIEELYENFRSTVKEYKKLIEE